MNKKDNIITLQQRNTDSDFYNNVFKKTERITACIVYVFSFRDSGEGSTPVSTLLENKSLKLHELSLKTLQGTISERRSLIDLRQCLVELGSTLEIALAARVFPADIGQTLNEYIDTTHRYLVNHYLQDSGVSLFDAEVKPTQAIAGSISNTSNQNNSSAPRAPQVRRQQRVTIPENDISSDAYLVYSQLTDRAERIKTILKAKPQSSVKDVSEIITDVSEKTIQRELNSLIEKGQVVREGEKRWSKYSVKKD